MNGPPPQVSPSAATGHKVCYRVRAHISKLHRLWRALVDRGANGTIIGRDMRVITTSEETINLSGVDDHTVRNLHLVSAGGVVETQRGPIILIVHQGAHMQDGKTILSPGQMEMFGCHVHDKAKTVSGHQPYIRTLEGHRIPLSIRRGLPYV